MPHFVIMGAGRVGVMLAHSLETAGHTVAVIDQKEQAFQRLRKDFQGQKVTGVGFDQETLKRAGIEQAYAFAAVSSGDNSNVLASRVARETFNVAHVVARINDPQRAEFFQRLGIPTVAAVRWSTDQVLRRILPEQSMTGDFREASGRLVLAELPLHAEWAGHSLADIEAVAEVRIAYITRFGEGMLPTEETSYQTGDVVHAMMRAQEVDEVAEVLGAPPADPEEQDLAEALAERSRGGARKERTWGPPATTVEDAKNARRAPGARIERS